MTDAETRRRLWDTELDNGRPMPRTLFDRDEVLDAAEVGYQEGFAAGEAQGALAERERLIARAAEIYDTKGSTLHDPGSMIRFFIAEARTAPCSKDRSPGETGP